MKRNRVLVFGGEFNNAGAMAMTFVTISEMKQRFPDWTVSMMTGSFHHALVKDVSFPVEADDDILRESAVGNRSFEFITHLLILSCKNIVKSVLRKPIAFKYSMTNLSRYKKHIQSAQVVLDISGYQLGSSWSYTAYKRYMNLIKMCIQCDTPLYLMPQSFGPFDFSDKQLEELKLLLPKVRLIFAREQEGYDYLTQKLGLKNVVLSTDLVLQNTCVNYDELLKTQEPLELGCMNKENNVAILPNMRVFDRCDNKHLLQLYKAIIDELLSQNKTVYLMRHAGEDIVPAKMLKSLYPDNNNVILLENLFLSYHFEEVVQKFDFIIASRYHAIVHAYKQNIPCIAIGWAIKYVDLLEKMQQSQYMFDVRSDLDVQLLLKSINNLADNLEEEKQLIAARLAETQNNNCFDIMEQDLKSELKKYEMSCTKNVIDNVVFGQ